MGLIDDERDDAETLRVEDEAIARAEPEPEINQALATLTEILSGVHPQTEAGGGPRG